MKLSEIRLFKKKEPMAEPVKAEAAPPSPRDRGAEAPSAGERAKGRLSVLPEEASFIPQRFTVLRLSLAAVLLAVSVLVRNIPDIFVLIYRIAAALCAGFDLILNSLRDFRAKVISPDGAPVILASIILC
jgi:hypothetical protein